MTLATIRACSPHLWLLVLLLLSLPLACDKKETPKPPTQQQSPPLQSSGLTDTLGTDRAATLPISNSYFVLDRRSNMIFGIDLTTNKVSNRIPKNEQLVGIEYDPQRNWVYEALADPTSGLDVFDVSSGKYLEKLRFPGAPSAMLYHPVQQKLYLVSTDSTNIRVFDPDSMKLTLKIPLTIQNNSPIGPKTINPGPMGKVITANAAHPSVTQILTADNFLAQTVIIHDANRINSAVFSFDGNSSFSCDTEQGSIYRVEFGTGRVMAELQKVDRPRLLQIEVISNTLVVVSGTSDLIMLNPDTFRETGKVSLAEYGDEIISLLIPPKANYAEVLLDYKGVTRWMRFDIQNWEPTRLVELI